MRANLRLAYLIVEQPDEPEPDPFEQARQAVAEAKRGGIRYDGGIK